jgi:hypothetical protein
MAEVIEVKRIAPPEPPAELLAAEDVSKEMWLCYQVLWQKNGG